MKCLNHEPHRVGGRTLVDWEAALDYVGGNHDVLLVALDAMLQECPGRLSDTERAIADSNPELLQRSAHTLAGNLRILGTTSAGEIALQLETLGRQGTTEGAADQLPQLKTDTTVILSEVKNYLESN